MDRKISHGTNSKPTRHSRAAPAWNSGRIIGQKRARKPEHVWAIGVRRELAENHRDLAVFNLAIDSKLHGCDLVKMKVVDVMAASQIVPRQRPWDICLDFGAEDFWLIVTAREWR